MEITEYLPVDFRTQMEAETLCGAEEIRLRVGQPLEILHGSRCDVRRDRFLPRGKGSGH